MFYPIQRGHLLRKQAKSIKFWVTRAKLEASEDHIWPAGRMLCMPALNVDTESVTHRDITIFESLLTTFEARVNFEAAGAVVKFGSRLNPNIHYQV